MSHDQPERIYDVHWTKEGSLADCAKGPPLERFALYQLIGRHPVSGPESLLYIGKTRQKEGKRLNDHERLWGKLEADDIMVRVATLRDFATWSEWHENQASKPFVDPAEHDGIVTRIEALLIYAHQPAYCSHSIASISRPSADSEHIRVFNTGRFGPLMPEVSTRRYVDQLT